MVFINKGVCVRPQSCSTREAEGSVFADSILACGIMGNVVLVFCNFLFYPDLKTCMFLRRVFFLFTGEKIMTFISS